MRPVLAFGDCCCLRLSVCISLCVNQLYLFVHTINNSGLLQARITKFKPKVQNKLVKVPIVLWSDRPRPVKDSLPHRVLKEYTGVVDAIEYMSIELSMKSRKWNMINIYKPPKVSWSPSSTCTYVPRPLHGPNCFTVSTLSMYTDLGSRGV